MNIWYISHLSNHSKLSTYVEELVLRTQKSKTAKPCSPAVLNRLWGTTKPRIISFPTTMPRISDPVKWALRVAGDDSNLMGTAMGSVVGGGLSKDEMIYVSRGGATSKWRKQLVAGVEQKSAIQLQVNLLCQKVPEFRDFVDATFKEAMRQRHPFGCPLADALFVTGPDHRYNAHCDLEDGFLFQLHGVKRIKVWGPHPQFFEQVVFNHDFRGNLRMFSGKAVEYELGPGQGFFFPRGVMHEIWIPSGAVSVSVAIRYNHLCSVLELVRDLCNLAKISGAFSLPPGAAGWDKFHAMLFNPSEFAASFVAGGFKAEKKMPMALKKELVKAIMPKSTKLKKMIPELLDVWWCNLTKGQNNSAIGALPRRPRNAEEQLAQWENERLGRATKGG